MVGEGQGVLIAIKNEAGIIVAWMLFIASAATGLVWAFVGRRRLALMEAALNDGGREALGSDEQELLRRADVVREVLAGEPEDPGDEARTVVFQWLGWAREWEDRAGRMPGLEGAALDELSRVLQRVEGSPGGAGSRLGRRDAMLAALMDFEQALHRGRDAYR